MILECYLRGFATACSPAGGWYGLDPFAGFGLNYSLTLGAEIPSSPLIMLEAGPPAATKVLLCEMAKRALAARAHRCEPYGSRAEVFSGDANEKVDEILERLPAALRIL